MKKAPLSFYVNLHITNVCMQYYDSTKSNPENRGLSTYVYWFKYVGTYVKSNAKFPNRIMDLIWNLNQALGDVFGFNPDIAMKYIVGYFANDELYKSYLDFVGYRNAIRDSYLGN